MQLPAFDLPGLPFRVAPGTGAASLTFALRGDRLPGRWAIGANRGALGARQRGRQVNDIERLVWRVVSGLKRSQVDRAR